jgi:hypothetical protein
MFATCRSRFYHALDVENKFNTCQHEESNAGFFGFLHCVVVEYCNMSEDHAASIFRVTECGSVGCVHLN